ncbi:hypothetical protein B0H17DRAFT_1141145 [Mycena rosella]|uniref:Uncharacterized protein n=1 Tax=Mycena rosella TaxID=1033263 RepID=A0AAD7D0U6_MYCRO|nr:hypothetical protein B0H17DRAFT_1141145 [Mycena rosella]
MVGQVRWGIVCMPCRPDDPADGPSTTEDAGKETGSRGWCGVGHSSFGYVKTHPNRWADNPRKCYVDTSQHKYNPSGDEDSSQNVAERSSTDPRGDSASFVVAVDPRLAALFTFQSPHTPQTPQNSSSS